MAGGTDTKLQRLFFIGRPFSPLYSFLMKTRSRLYQKGLLRQHRLEVPVISVGNLVMGGTGKTPLVQYIAGLLQEQNRKPAVLSRGYKGTARNVINIVSNTTDILMTATEAGDESRLLAEKLPGIPVLTGKKRYATGRFAIDTFGADILILDDGFQHMALQRDIDLVLFNAGQGLGNGRVLPGGELREPVSGLNRASAFVISTTDDPLDPEKRQFVSLLETLYPEKPVFISAYKAERRLHKVHNGKNETISIAAACNLPIFGFSGIAQPGSFKKTLENNGMKLTGFQEFADHHSYSASDIRLLRDNARISGAETLITTEKDFVKLRSVFPEEIPLLVQPVQMSLSQDFDRYLNRQLAVI